MPTATPHTLTEDDDDELFRIVMENASDLVMLVAATGDLVYTSPGFMRAVGGRPGGTDVEDALGYVHTDDVELARHKWGRALEGQAQSMLVRHRHADGSWRWFHAVGKPIRYQGRPHILVTHHDVTDRALAVDALREREELFELLAGNADVMLTIYDLDGRRVYVSPSCERILGTVPREPLGAVHPDDRAEMAATWQRILAGERTQTMYRCAAADGSWRWLDSQGCLVEYRGSPRVMAVSRDVTRRKQLEDEYRHAQKMEVVGRLTGGIAHDFNNLLVAILGYADLMLARRDREDPDRELLAGIREAGERAAALTRRLLAFSRKRALRPQVCDVNALLEDLARLLRHLIGSDIELQLALDPLVGPVLLDPSQLEQAIVNLAINARDAMPRGGVLAIETRCAGAEIAVIVTDDGQGMDEATRARVFEPFFTTKEDGKGTGLGLAMVHGFVVESGGRIEIATTPGVGTSFTLHLPHASAP